MKRTLISLFTAMSVTAFALAASAATSISIGTDASTYLAGGTITLTVTATSNGGETDNTVFGAILYENSKVTIATQSQTPMPPGDWTQGALTCTTARCVAFSQVRSAGVTAVGLTNATVATQTWTIGGAVPINTTIKFSWQTTPTTQRLDWFGITSTSQSAPGGVTVTVVPEPTTAALLGLGLFGLAVAGRRRA